MGILLPVVEALCKRIHWWLTGSLFAIGSSAAPKYELILEKLSESALGGPCRISIQSAEFRQSLGYGEGFPQMTVFRVNFIA